ncbi:MAG: hypothetical protein SV375_07270, partial [Thermodesulfobacteriota bacterium]|nr:hypothetical protein [Thermodesulfobacteriota bacterium]
MKDISSGTSSQMTSTQVRLDVYYYTLTWDKLKKIFNKFKKIMNPVQKNSNAIPEAFKRDYKDLKRRIDHLLGEFHRTARNEYEHPSLEPNRVGSIIEWGSLFEDSNGNIKVHVGKEQFSVVRKDHLDRLNSLWTNLIDVFLKYFSDKTPSSELFRLKNQIEHNIDDIIDTYNQYRSENKNEEANNIIYQILMSDIHLAMEGMPLDQQVK